jgi:type I restriction enzyme, S subunit
MTWQHFSLDELIKMGKVSLHRGNIISKRDIDSNPGEYPIYSSATKNNGMFGRYGSFMFDEELITWSVDGGGQLFYRPKHRFSVTNVGGILRVLDPTFLNVRFLHLALDDLHSRVTFDWSRKAHPSVIRLVYAKVPVPPLEEQKRIVEALDDHLSRLDKALAESGYAAKATMRFSTSLLHSMFTGDLMQRELGIEDINLVVLSDVAEIQSGGTPKGLDRLTSDVPSESHTIPFYKVGDMNLDSRYMLASRAYLTSANVEKLSLKVIPVGSVIFPKAGGAIATDKKRLVKVPGPIDLNCMAVTPRSQLLPSYLAWWFDSFKLSDLSNGSILPQIGKTSVMQVRLPCPSLSEQERVVHYLEEKITEVRTQAQNIDGVAASIKTLRRSILNDAFSGKLVNGWYSSEQ